MHPNEIILSAFPVTQYVCSLKETNFLHVVEVLLAVMMQIKAILKTIFLFTTHILVEFSARFDYILST